MPVGSGGRRFLREVQSIGVKRLQATTLGIATKYLIVMRKFAEPFIMTFR